MLDIARGPATGETLMQRSSQNLLSVGECHFPLKWGSAPGVPLHVPSVPFEILFFLTKLKTLLTYM